MAQCNSVSNLDGSANVTVTNGQNPYNLQYTFSGSSFWIASFTVNSLSVPSSQTFDVFYYDENPNSPYYDATKDPRTEYGYVRNSLCSSLPPNPNHVGLMEIKRPSIDTYGWITFVTYLDLQSSVFGIQVTPADPWQDWWLLRGIIITMSVSFIYTDDLGNISNQFDYNATMDVGSLVFGGGFF